MTMREFGTYGKQQWNFGLLRLAEEFADVRVSNEGSIEEYSGQIDALFAPGGLRNVRGLSRLVRPRHGLVDNQLYGCLLVLGEARRPLYCDEIQAMTGRDGRPILDTATRTKY